MKDDRPYELTIDELKVGKVYERKNTYAYSFISDKGIIFYSKKPIIDYSQVEPSSYFDAKFREYLEPKEEHVMSDHGDMLKFQDVWYIKKSIFDNQKENLVAGGSVKKTEPMLQGISRRDYFAAMAMQGLNSRHHEDYTFGDIVHVAREQADKLIAELDKENKDV